MNIELDAHDLALLEHLQHDSRMSQSELGEQIHLSTAAVNRRLKRLKEHNIIQRYSVVLTPEAVGYPLTIVVQIEAESERIDLLDMMKHSFAACPYVQQCYYVTGEWDFILILTIQDMTQYTLLTRQLFFQNNNVKRFKTLVAMHRVKTGLEIPLNGNIRLF
ncbi:MAG: Lrp/AsnC family transcriptional regulator [Pseudomonadota bacterium]